MYEVKKGDVVTRKSYGNDLLFKVIDINVIKNGERNIVLNGVDYRLEADSPESDLKAISLAETEERRRQDKDWLELKYVQKSKNFLNRTPPVDSIKSNDFIKTGKVLHVDSSSSYMEKCREHYLRLGVEAVLVQLPESEQASKVGGLLKQHRPDILVITGHDGMVKSSTDCSDINNYRNSLSFVNAVKEARKYNSSLDDLIIFAGACQSNYEALLQAGANFASSPKRILIHMMDPAIVAEKVSKAEIDKVLSIKDIVKETKKGLDGIGGLETRGKARSGAPKITYCDLKDIEKLP